jgi:hypothetical protein
VPIRLKASFREWLLGSYWRLDAPTDERAMQVALEASSPDVAAAVRTKTWHLSGMVDAESLATASPLEGRVVFRVLEESRILYRFAFMGDDGRRCELVGEKAWSALTPLDGVTLLVATMWGEDGKEFARATLRFDLRADWLRWLRSVRLSMGRG